MPPELHAAGRWVHVAGGFAAVGVGVAVMLAPKAGPRAGAHRRLGRAYAGLLGASAAAGVPLAYLRGSPYLMLLGAVTLGLVGWGWRAGAAARAAGRRGDPAAAGRAARRHLVLMGSSYVGAWSGFFANNFVLGPDPWAVYVYVFGPPAAGAVLIARAAVRAGRNPAHGRPAGRPIADGRGLPSLPPGRPAG